MVREKWGKIANFSVSKNRFPSQQVIKGITLSLFLPPSSLCLSLALELSCSVDDPHDDAHLTKASLRGRSTLVTVLSHLVLSPMNPEAAAIVKTVPRQ